MRKTYAPNAIIIGWLVGWLLWLKVNPAVGIIGGIIVTVVGWAIIRGIENAAQSGADTIDNAVKRSRNESENSLSEKTALSDFHSDFQSTDVDVPENGKPDCESNEENSYLAAVALMSRACDSIAYQRAEEQFNVLGDYRNAKELATKCAELSEKCSDEAEAAKCRRNNGTYNSAIDYMKKGSIDYVRTAYHQFKSISGWLDADELALVCEKKIKEIETAKADKVVPQSANELCVYEHSADKSFMDESSLRAIRRIKGLCQNCGGDFAGIKNKICKICGKPKDY